ncbi:MAG: nodulation protein NfeD [Anaerolineaceae bacterium]
MKKRFFYTLFFLFLLASTVPFIVPANPVGAQSQSPNVVVVKLDGPLTPTWKEILQRGIDQSSKNNSTALIVELNTTGGSIDLMNDLIQMILVSPTPVVVYVSPQGSMAASAGTLLVLSGKVSAMAPDTILGAASPVGSQGADLSTTEELKTKEALKATARSLITWRGADAVALAEQAIDAAKAATAEEAKQAGLIDIIAVDETDLINQLDGRVLTVNGASVTLHTQNATRSEIPITVVEMVLGLLTNPNIVFVLLAIGVQAILIEISTPGGWVAGFIGAVLLSLSIYGLGLLPVNYVGLIFMGIAFVLFILDIKAPTHGALTAAGTGSFIAGGLILFNSASVPSFANASVGLIIGMGLLLGATFFALVLLAVRAMKTPVITGKETMIGKEGYAVTEVNPAGIVHVAGEQWSARLAKKSQPITVDDRLVVEEVQGLKLIVKKK